MDVGFIGLGNMGGPMAANLLKGGHRLWGYDLSPFALARAVERGAIPCSSPREASQGRDVVFLSLTYPHIVERVVLGEEGVLSASPVPPLLVDMGTGLPTITRRIAAAAREKGCQLIDAPVSGLPEAAASASLVVFVGGPPEAYERALPLLKLLGKAVIHVGDLGAGQTMKLVNNTISGVTRVIIAEALMLGVLGGIEPRKIYEVISISGGNSNTFQTMAPRMLKGDFEPAGSVDVLHKDLDLAATLAQEMGLPMPVANLAKQVYQTAKAAGLGKRDAAAVVTLLEDLMGVDVRDRSAG